MSVTFPVGAYLKRTAGTFLDPTGSYSQIYWVRYDDDPGDKIINVLFAVDGDYSQPYIKVASATGDPSSIQLTAFDGTTTKKSVSFPIDALRWNPVAVTLLSHTSIQLALVGKTRVTVSGLDFTGVSFAAEYLGDDGIVAESHVALAIYRSWSAAENGSSGDFFRAEFAVTADAGHDPGNLFADTNLQTNGTDSSGNGRDWVSVGAPVFTAGLPDELGSTYLIENFTSSTADNTYGPYRWGWFSGNFPFVVSGACSATKLFGCTTSQLWNMRTIVNDGPSTGSIAFHYALHPADSPSPQSLVLLQILDYGGTDVASPYKWKATLTVDQDGTLTLATRNGAGAPLNPTVISATGSSPMSVIGEAIGLEVVWDLTTTIKLWLYMNESLIASIDTADAGLPAKAWNQMIFAVLRSANWNSALSNISVMSTAAQQGITNCTSALPLNAGNAGNCQGAIPSATSSIRRVRRFQISYAQNYRLFLRRLEFLLQPGVGLTTGQGSDPTLMFRLSKNGGISWGNEVMLSVGQIGEYYKRVYRNNLGSGRNLVGEISTSDPVNFSLIDCLADLEEGMS